MNNQTITVDDSQVQELFKGLSEDQLNRILFGAVKRGAFILKSNTTSILRNKVDTSKHSTGKAIEDGVRMKGHKAYCEANVNIMGDYRLIFLEKGTKIRKSKSGAIRGQIKPRNFFAEARMNEQPVYDAMDKQIEKELRKLKK